MAANRTNDDETSDRSEVKMTDRILLDSATGELLFMEQGADGRLRPAIAAMEAWREARLRLYRLTPGLYATMPDLRLWPVMTDWTNIDHLIEHPWIPDGSAFELPELIEPASLAALDDLYVSATGDGGGPPPQPPGGGAVAIQGAESRQRQPEPSAPALVAALATVHVTHNHVHTWDLDSLWRPALLWDDPFTTRPTTALAALAALLAPSEPTAPVTAMPKHIADLVLRDAESRGATCAITMEPIKVGSASVTSCGHVFETGAIKEWLTTRATCPECRQACAV
jgi:hypothetical protein